MIKPATGLFLTAVPVAAYQGACLNEGRRQFQVKIFADGADIAGHGGDTSAAVHRGIHDKSNPRDATERFYEIGSFSGLEELRAKVSQGSPE